MFRVDVVKVGRGDMLRFDNDVPTHQPLSREGRTVSHCAHRCDKQDALLLER
jgi:hypothetical protein